MVHVPAVSELEEVHTVGAAGAAVAVGYGHVAVADALVAADCARNPASDSVCFQTPHP